MTKLDELKAKIPNEILKTLVGVNNQEETVEYFCKVCYDKGCSTEDEIFEHFIDEHFSVLTSLLESFKLGQATFSSKENVDEKNICSCGFPQSYPIRHEHERTQRENDMIKHVRSQTIADVERLIDERIIKAKEILKAFENNPNSRVYKNFTFTVELLESLKSSLNKLLPKSLMNIFVVS